MCPLILRSTFIQKLSYSDNLSPPAKCLCALTFLDKILARYYLETQGNSVQSYSGILLEWPVLSWGQNLGSLGVSCYPMLWKCPVRAHSIACGFRWEMQSWFQQSLDQPPKQHISCLHFTSSFKINQYSSLLCAGMRVEGRTQLLTPSVEIHARNVSFYFPSLSYPALLLLGAVCVSVLVSFYFC